MFEYHFQVPEQKKIRMIVHTDCKNEADDQYAVAHHLMTPKFAVTGLIAGHFDKANQGRYPDGGTAKASYDEIIKVLDLMHVKDEYPVFMGSARPLADENTPNICPGAQFIVDEAMKDDSRPLFIAMQGAITDLASAILMEPKICERMTAIWIGGGVYPEGGFEFKPDEGYKCCQRGNEIKDASVAGSHERVQADVCISGRAGEKGPPIRKDWQLSFHSDGRAEYTAGRNSTLASWRNLGAGRPGNNRSSYGRE